MNRKYFVVAAVVVMAGLLAGCGSSGDSLDQSAAAGEELFKQSTLEGSVGCISCHSLEPDTVIVGPSMADFGIEAEEEGEELGMTAEEFIRQSIVDPNAVVPEGFNEGVMPLNYGEVLSDSQIEDLVNYLSSLR